MRLSAARQSPGPDQDAYGQIYLAHLEGREAHEIMERDDGLIYCGDPSDYFAAHRLWPAAERRAMRFVRGRVLDVGCGAGRVSLYLQGRGQDVLAIDASALSIAVAKRRGVRKARVLSIADLGATRRGGGAAAGRFDTVILMRNNLGLGDSRQGAGRLLRRLAALTSARGRLITDAVDPRRIRDPLLRPLPRHRLGTASIWAPRYRVRFCRSATPWFRYLMLAPGAWRRLVAGTDWRVLRLIDDGTPRSIVVLDKRRQAAAGQRAAR